MTNNELLAIGTQVRIIDSDNIKLFGFISGHAIVRDTDHRPRLMYIVLLQDPRWTSDHDMFIRHAVVDADNVEVRDDV